MLEQAGVFKRHSVAHSFTHGSVTLQEFANCTVDGAIVLCGFASATLTPVLSASYIREKLDLPLIGAAKSNSFPPSAIVEGGVPMPPVRIFGNEKVVVFLCEFKLSPELAADLATLMLQFAERHNSKMIFAVEGLPVQDPTKEPMRFLTSSQEAGALFAEQQMVPLKDCVISGVAGILLSECAYSEKCDVTVIVAPTTPYPDAASSVIVVKALSHYLNMDIDSTALEQKAQALESGVEKLLKKELDQKKASTSVSHSMYL